MSAFSTIAVRRLAAGLWLAGLMHGAAAAQSFDVPEGFTSTVERVDFDGAEQAVLHIQPEEGTFADYSVLTLHPLASDIDDPAAWLESRVAVEAWAPGIVDELFDGEDSPFNDPLFDSLRGALEALRQHLGEVGEMPLEFCEGTERAESPIGPYHRLACKFEIGAAGLYAEGRLQAVDGVWYYTTVQSLNQRRYRHLIAIANSFYVD